MHSKDAGGIANMVDPNPTAPQGLHCLTRPKSPMQGHYSKCQSLSFISNLMQAIQSNLCLFIHEGVCLSSQSSKFPSVFPSK